MLARMFILPNWLGNMSGLSAVAETTYHEDKVYLPKDVREKLGLVDGDVLHIEVVNKGIAKISVVRGCNAGSRVFERLDKPPNLGKLKGKLSREEIYEDIT